LPMQPLRGPLTIINASEQKKPECLGLERPRVTGKAT